MTRNLVFLLFLLCPLLDFLFAQSPTAYRFEEQNGIVSVEAEHFTQQDSTKVRKWYVIDTSAQPNVLPDGDTAHILTASGNAYLEVLPDTRRTHDDTLIPGENFSNQPGKMAILYYPVYFHTTGRYYVWVRAYSTGTEDNGLHVGLNGEWVASGQRMQWCEGKHQWTWASKQRTDAEHCGVERQIFLDISQPGWHTITFSMREDGFEFDKFTLSKSYQKPESEGAPETLYDER